MEPVERIREWLEERGCDGLSCEGCSCGLDALYECGEVSRECRPAREER